MDINRQTEQFWPLLHKLEAMPQIREMEKYPQHKITNSFCHSHNVAVAAFYFASEKRWEIDLETLVRGAMLHDFYLYDIDKSGLSDYAHGKLHPLKALENAQKLFSLNEKEKKYYIKPYVAPAFCSPAKMQGGSACKHGG